MARFNFKSLAYSGLTGGTVVLALALSAPAQRTRQVDPNREIMNQTIDHDMQVKSLEQLTKQDGSSLAVISPATVNQVIDDFGQIQEINRKIMSAYVAGTPPDYKRLSQQVAEINKRAARLNTNLMLPEPTEPRKLKEGSPLLDLNKLVTSFVSNALFQNQDTVDASLGVRAKQDLLHIIDLSGRIKRSADILSKNGGKAK